MSFSDFPLSVEAYLVFGLDRGTRAGWRGGTDRQGRPEVARVTGAGGGTVRWQGVRASRRGFIRHKSTKAANKPQDSVIWSGVAAL